jgi:APA family basic amino acid/polyamine antiporter
MPEDHPRDRLSRELRLRDATWLVVSGVIGSGIFLTPAAIAGHLPHPGAILAVWTLGGVLSLVGALANAELGAMYPRAGGDYVYLREAFHPLAGFLVGWLTFFVIYAGTIATLAAGFAAALGGFVALGATLKLLVAIGLIWIVSGLNYLGVRWGALANNITAVVKVFGLVAFACLAPIFGEGRGENLMPLVRGVGELGLGSLGLALSPVLFSYLGWNSTVYVASEIRNPSRNIPGSLFVGVAICTVVYLLVNAAYLYALPLVELQSAPNAGEAAARALYGDASGRLVGAFVLASILGTLSATVLVGARIAYAMALDGLFFRGGDRSHPDYRTPSVAIAVQAATASVILLVLGTFERALDSTTFAILLAILADVAALYRLRSTQPERPRPYRAWGYPWVPAVYAAVCGCVAALLLWERPVECLLGLALLGTGLPFYAAFTRRGSRGAP